MQTMRIFESRLPALSATGEGVRGVTIAVVPPVRRRRLAPFATAVAIAAVAACSSPSAPDPGSEETPPASSPNAASDLVELTNVQRARDGLPSLRVNGALERAARIQADQIAAAGRLEHTLDGAPYPCLEDRMAAVGYEWRLVGENLAFGQSNAATAVETWMRSPSHRANILNAEFTEIGAARVVDPNGRPYYVQVFARPR
jgi:uncharacterized protein YkwD